jgi:hypothetical protein
MFPDSLNYLSLIVALLGMAPLAIGLCHYMGHVRFFISSAISKR